MAIQDIVIKYVVDTSDLERSEQILIDNAKAADMSEDAVKDYNKQLKISAKEVDALRRETVKLEKAIDGATDDDDIRKYNDQLAIAKKRMRDLGVEADKTEKKVGGIGSSLVAGFAGGLVAGLFDNIIGGIQDITAESIELFKVQEEAEAKVEAAIIATNGAAGRSLDQLKQKATEIQGLTLFGDEQILEAQSTLLTFKEVQGEVFDNAIGLAADLSTVLNTDLESSTLQLGKALNDPITGITALTRAGITFNEQQKEQIKTLAESGKVAEAQGIILEELATQVGGAAALVAQSGAGPLVQLENQIGDIKEAIGAELIPAQTSALKLQELFYQGILQTIKGIVFFINALREIPNFLKENRVEIAALTAGILALNAANIAAAIATIRKAAAEKAAAIGTRALAAAQRILNLVLSANPIGIVIVAVTALTVAFAQLYKRSQTLRAGIAGLFKAFGQVADNYITGFVQRFTALGDILKGVFTLDTDLIQQGAEAFKNARKLGEGVVEAFNEGFEGKIKEERAKGIAEELRKRAEEEAAEAEAIELNIPVEANLVADQKSLADLKEQLKKLQDQFQKATTDEERKRINREIRIVQRQIVQIESKFENDPKSKEKIKAKQDELAAQVLVLTTKILIETAGGAETLEGLKLQEAEQIKRLQSQAAFIELQKQNEQLANQAILNIQNDFAEKRASLIEKTTKEGIEAQADAIALEIENIGRSLATANLNITKIEAIDIEKVRQQFNQGLISKEEFENELSRIESEATAKREQAALDSLIRINEAQKQALIQSNIEIAQLEQTREEDRTEAERIRLEQLKALNQELTDETISTEQEIAEARIGINKDADDQIAENRKRSNEDILEGIAKGLAKAADATGTLSDLFASQAELRIKQAEGNEQKQEEIRRREFERQKRFAIAEASMKAASSILNVFASTPFPASLLAAVLIGIQTATQINTIRAASYAEGSNLLTPSSRRKIKGNVSGKRQTDDIPALVKGKYGEKELINIDEGERITSKAINKKFFDDLNAIENNSFSPGIIAKAANIDRKVFNQFVKGGGKPMIQPLAIPVSRMVPIDSNVNKIPQIDYKRLGKSVADEIESKKWSKGSSFWRELDNIEYGLPKKIAIELSKIMKDGRTF